MNRQPSTPLDWLLVALFVVLFWIAVISVVLAILPPIRLPLI
jgi:hypothetical protein